MNRSHLQAETGTNLNQSKINTMSKFNHISSYHLGNGLSVCDRTKEVRGDYKKLAHISVNRVVQFYGRVCEDDKQHILNIARLDNSNISATQEQKVFRLQPNKDLTFKIEGKFYKPKVLRFEGGHGKNVLFGTIYAEDTTLISLNKKGFSSFDKAQEMANKYGYQLTESNY